MLLTTRRRLLGLMAVCAAAPLLPPLAARAQEGQADSPPDDAPPADAADAPAAPEKPKCYVKQEFGPWLGQATESQAGARLGDIEFTSQCAVLWGSFDVNDDYDAKISLVGDPGGIPLDKDFLIQDTNRIQLHDANGKLLYDAKLCGVCTDLENDESTTVLPLAISPYLRDDETVELSMKMGDKGDCRFTLQLKPMREAIDWAVAEREKLQEQFSDGKCQEQEGCFITTACCTLLGLADDCFELRTLRRYRDEVLEHSPEGRAAISEYYRTAPELLRRLHASGNTRYLLQIYWRHILPSAIAAHLGLNDIAYRLYRGMMQRLSARVSAA